MEKERPGDLKKKIKRVVVSRDNLKQRSREKTRVNKTLRDRNAELTESRERWKKETKKLRKYFRSEQEGWEKQLQEAQAEIARERRRAEEERKRADLIKEEINAMRKKNQEIEALIPKTGEKLGCEK
jgi:sigma54-dependent transcription regulator